MKILLKIITPIALVALLWVFSTKKPSYTLPVMKEITEFKLQDQEGKTINSQDLRGKIWLSNFFFTRCKGVCPLMTQKVAQLLKKLSDIDELQQLSISMDPEHDQADILKKFAAQYHANPEHWHFLTGTKKEVIRICKDIFNLPAGEDPDMHSTRLVLIDRKGKIRGYYDSFDEKAMESLEAHIRFLYAESFTSSS